MNKKEVIQKFLDNPKYMTNGAGLLSKVWDVPRELIVDARNEARIIQNAKTYVDTLSTKKQPNNKNFKRLFFDIETSYNICKSWRTGYNINLNPGDIITERAIICLSYKWEGDTNIYNLRWDDNQSDKQLLKDFKKVILKADEVIAHNGDRFDIKWLRTRCFIHGIPFPSYVKSLDTLLKTRSMFNFQSNKLDYLTKIVGVSNKMETGGLALWDDIILNKSEQAMNKMIAYCNQDVKALEEFYLKLFPYIKPETHVGVHNGKDKYSCPQCGEMYNISKIKSIITSSGNKQHLFTCNNCTSYYKISNSTFKRYLESI